MSDNKIFMTVEEVAEAMGVSKSYAYKLVNSLNKKLKEMGWITISGKVDRKYFYEQFYGTKN